MEITIRDLANKLKMNIDTLRVWLGNYRFEKYRCKYCLPVKYRIGYYFWKDFYIFLKNKYSPTACRIKEFIQGELECQKQ